MSESLEYKKPPQQELDQPSGAAQQLRLAEQVG